MLTLAKERGINPDAVVMDAWYSGLESLKHIGNLGWTWVSNLRKNRKLLGYTYKKKSSSSQKGYWFKIKNEIRKVTGQFKDISMAVEHVLKFI
ncbi:MAG: transposase, partial [Rickettsia endosymbiont of Ixodes persulcatus]|nr:transposase [Rickettsia endosymbiont of Ixodes persulcatus]